MIKAGTLIFLVKTVHSELDTETKFQVTQICLGMKKRGFAKDKWNGFGGKVEKGETLEKAAIRELLEESNVSANESDLIHRANFYYKEPQGDWTVDVFFLYKWDGEPVETDEMKPEWFDVDKIPYDRMWKNDRLWLPRLLESDKFLNAEITNGEEGETIESRIYEV